MAPSPNVRLWKREANAGKPEGTAATGTKSFFREKQPHNATDTITEEIVEETTTATAKTEAEIIGKETIELTDYVARKTDMPTWGRMAIIIAVSLVILGVCFFCIRRFFRKRRSKDGKKGKGVDLKSVQLLGSAYKEKIQPDMEELTENTKERDEGNN